MAKKLSYFCVAANDVNDAVDGSSTRHMSAMNVGAVKVRQKASPAIILAKRLKRQARKRGAFVKFG